MQIAVAAGVDEEEVAVGNAELTVTTAADGVDRFAVGLGWRGDPDLRRADDFDDVVNGRVGVTGFGVEGSVFDACSLVYPSGRGG